MPRLCAGEEQRQFSDILGLGDTANAALGQRLGANLLDRLVLRLGILRKQHFNPLGLRRTGVDDIDVDVIPVAHRRETLGKIGEGGIDRTADQKFRARRPRRSTDDVDDAAMRVLQQRPEQPRQPHPAEEFQGKAIGPVGIWLIGKFAAFGGAGIVHQHIAAAEAGFHLIENLLAAVERAQIAGDGHRREAARGSNGFGGLCKVGGAGRRQHGLRALARERGGDCPANAAAAAGDDHDFTVEFLRHSPSPRVVRALYAAARAPATH